MNLKDVFGQTILYACNDWGFGHVARSIPIIEQLMFQNNTIYFAGNKKQRMIECADTGHHAEWLAQGVVQDA